ncbi:MAG: nicotinamidase [Acidobacteriaceae bacterium]
MTSWSPTSTDALLVIDMQRDFLPGGALAVDGGDSILPGINAAAARFEHVLLTQDWHPRGHISFASTHADEFSPWGTPASTPEGRSILHTPYGIQQLWPDHCIQGTTGAELHPALSIPHAELILRKGFRKQIDSYSAFMENDRQTPTGLAGYLRERRVTRLFFSGLAYDFCVGFSAVAAAQLGFQSIVLEDLTRAVNLPGSIQAINGAFATAGVLRISSTALRSR